MKKNIFTILLLFVVTTMIYGQSPTAPPDGNAQPKRDFEIKGRYYDHTETVDALGNKKVGVTCYIVHDEVCIKVTLPYASMINPQTQNGPLPASDYYTNLVVNNAAQTTYSGDVTAHYQNFYQGDMNYREHTFFINTQ